MSKRGFTAVELIIGMTAGAAVALVAVFLWAPVDNWMFTQARRSGTSEAQAAVMRMAKEIRRIKNPGNIITMTATDIKFTDIDSQTVEFKVSGTDLLRGSDVLARNVVSLAFAYLDANGNATGSAAAVRTVRMTLKITSGTTTVNMRSSATIRNTES